MLESALQPNGESAGTAQDVQHAAAADMASGPRRGTPESFRALAARLSKPKPAPVAVAEPPPEPSAREFMWPEQMPASPPRAAAPTPPPAAAPHAPEPMAPAVSFPPPTVNAYVNGVKPRQTIEEAPPAPVSRTVVIPPLPPQPAAPVTPDFSASVSADAGQWSITALALDGQSFAATARATESGLAEPRPDTPILVSDSDDIESWEADEADELSEEAALAEPPQAELPAVEEIAEIEIEPAVPPAELAAAAEFDPELSEAVPAEEWQSAEDEALLPAEIEDDEVAVAPETPADAYDWSIQPVAAEEPVAETIEDLTQAEAVDLPTPAAPTFSWHIPQTGEEPSGEAEAVAASDEAAATDAINDILPEELPVAEILPAAAAQEIIAEADQVEPAFADAIPEPGQDIVAAYGDEEESPAEIPEEPASEAMPEPEEPAAVEVSEFEIEPEEVVAAEAVAEEALPELPYEFLEDENIPAEFALQADAEADVVPSDELANVVEDDAEPLPPVQGVGQAETVEDETVFAAVEDAADDVTVEEAPAVIEAIDDISAVEPVIDLEVQEPAAEPLVETPASEELIDVIDVVEPVEEPAVAAEEPAPVLEPETERFPDEAVEVAAEAVEQIEEEQLEPLAPTLVVDEEPVAESDEPLIAAAADDDSMPVDSAPLAAVEQAGEPDPQAEPVSNEPAESVAASAMPEEAEPPLSVIAAVEDVITEPEPPPSASAESFAPPSPMEPAEPVRRERSRPAVSSGSPATKPGKVVDIAATLAAKFHGPGSILKRRDTIEDDPFGHAVVVPPPALAAATTVEIAEPDVQTGEVARSLLDIMSAPTSSTQPQERALAADTLLRLIPRIPLRTLISVVERVCMMEAPPALLITRLIRDPRAEVAGPLLEKGGIISDQDLLSVVEENDEAKHRMIARRRLVSTALCDALIARGEPSVLLTLVRNPGASLSHDAFYRLCEKAKSQHALQAPLATRADTPAPVAFELFWVLPAELRRLVLSRFLTDSENLNRILKIALSVGADEFSNAEQRSPGGESIDRIVTLLVEGRNAEAARLAESLGITCEENARRIFTDSEGEPLTVLFKVIGLTRARFGETIEQLLSSPAAALRPERNIQELQNIFDSLSFNKARVLLTYWDWASRKSGPYAALAA